MIKKMLLLTCIFLLFNGCDGPQPKPFTYDVPPEPVQKHSAPEPSKIDNLQKAVNYAKQIQNRIKDIEDYTCTLTKRERINGRLLNYEQCQIKVRHQPFSAYMRYDYPSTVAGREILYIGGDSMLVKRGGKRLQNATVNVGINSPLALENSRYPITNLGFKYVISELISVGNIELKYPQNEIQVIESTAKIEGRACLLIQITHLVKRREYEYYIARIYIDKELNLPIRHEVYDWSDNENTVLIGEYTYTNLKLNVGLTNVDFNSQNSNYGFRR